MSDAPQQPTLPGDLAPVDERPQLPLLTRRVLTQSIALVTTALAVAAAIALPTGYVVRMPGPTFDTLGTGGTPVIEVTGAETFPSTGQLRFTTVSALGNRDRTVPVARLVRAWLDPDEGVYPVEAIFPEGTTSEQTAQQGQAEMVTSQESATVAALRALGRTVVETLTAVSTDPEMKAYGVVLPGDVLLALDGTPIVSFEHLGTMLDKIEPGTTVTLRVERAGTPQDLEVVTSAGPPAQAGGVDRSFLGVSVDRSFETDPVVTMHIDDVGGPSAGTMFALGIMDLLTPEDETGGQIIAGTGTMAIDGTVGPIGGITYKMRGARDDGARWFLAPAENCAEAVGHVPDGMRAVKVATLDEAYDAVVAIGAGRGDTLPTCS
ncbi:PDZ domain-containing protein [Sanguibacter sp. HDW7]|uniref:YlbL family protein n=1 Tax=Sanguibacter sp. HDW7 TaxID=2714931 RepID=UPI001F107026|nr:PDZ domain-containing protein [Sanguibacter sp. HDW7]